MMVTNEQVQEWRTLAEKQRENIKDGKPEIAFGWAVVLQLCEALQEARLVKALDAHFQE